MSPAPYTDHELAARIRAHMHSLDQDALAKGPLGLARYLDPQVIARPHMWCISDALESLQPGSNARVMVFCPPQVGKSFTATWGVFWWLAQHAAYRNVIIGSWGSYMAGERGYTLRKYVTEYGDRYGLRLQRGSASVKSWKLVGGGGVFSGGTRSGIAGVPADFAVVDDPFGSRADAESRRTRDRVYNWWSGDLGARLSPGAPVLIVNTRWHLDDLSGRLLEDQGRIEDGGVWRVVFLPAIAVPANLKDGIPHDGLGREPGEPLTHHRVPRGDRAAALAHWEHKRKTSTPRDWASLFQCLPREEKDALVSRALLREWRKGAAPQATRKAVSLDPSGNGRSTAGIIAGYLAEDRRLYVTHDRTDVLSIDQWAERTCLLAHETSADVIFVERNFGGGMATSILLSTWESLINSGRLPNTAVLPFIQEVHARQGKRIRAEPMAQQIVLGNLLSLGIHPELEEELATWSITDTDSPGRIDALTHLAFGMLVGIGTNPAGLLNPADVVGTEGVDGAAGFPDYPR